MNGQEGQQELDVKGLLAQAAKVPAGVNLKEFNPMESIPTLAVGKDILPGSTINGTYVRTEVIASRKFTYSKVLNAEGVPTQERHILRLANGQLMGLWSTGELGNVFEKRAIGSYISLRYVSKGKNADNNDQHFFEYKEDVGAAQ